MGSSSSLVVVRRTGLLAWVAIGVVEAARATPEVSAILRATPRAVSPLVAVVLLAGVVALPWLVFGASFLWIAQRVEGSRPRRSSLVALAVGTLLGAVACTDYLPLVAIEVPLVLQGRAAWSWMAAQSLAALAAGLSVAGTPAFEPIFCDGGSLPGPVVVAMTLGALLAWQWLAFAVGTVAAREWRAAAELRRLNGELLAAQDLLGQSARMAERVHIARELHDAIGHHLTALSVNLDLASRRAEGDVAAAVREAHAVTRLLLGDVRQIVGQLRHEEGLDLRRALEALAESTQEPQVHLDLPEGLRLDPQRAHTLYRCAQEALTNAVRHARARQVRVLVAQLDRELCLTVSDDGDGTPSIVAGAGLRGLRERVELAGGQLELRSAPRQGFTLIVRLPAVEEAA